VTSLPSILGFGILLGMQHATDADHLAAISTMVSQTRRPLDALKVGVAWGLGHTTTLVLMGVLVLVAKVPLPEQVVSALELTVGVVLVVLGVRVLRRIATPTKDEHRAVHLHADESHTHLARADRWRAYVIGCLHGLAGSGALMLLIVSTFEHSLAGLVYVLVFGFGTLLGMGLMSTLLSLPFAFFRDPISRGAVGLRALTGLVSVGLGLAIIVERLGELLHLGG